MQKRRVVITGMGVITSLGESLDALWQALVAGKSGIGKIARFDAEPFGVCIGGECTQFDPGNYMAKYDAKHMDRFAQFAVAAGLLAFRDSGIELAKEDPYEIGVIIGSGIGGIQEMEDQHNRLREKGPTKVSAFTVPRLMANAGAGNVSIQLGLKGPCSAVTTACATGGNAIGDAGRLIQHGEVTMMIAGGAEAALTPLGLGAFAGAKALSKRNDEPTKASRPFDKDRDGFVMGEGAGVVVLEEYEHAKARGARIYAELLGYGCSADASHITQPDPEGVGAARAMRKAIAESETPLERMGYINAHGTSTAVGDMAETLALKCVLGDHARKIPISSTKSHMGHLLGASGGVEAVVSALALVNQVMPPTINLDNPDDGCDLDYVPHTAREGKFDRVMSNSFGFGGHNVSLVLGKV